MSMLHVTPCDLYFVLIKSATDITCLMDKWHVLDLNGQHVEADTHIVLRVKHACKYFFQTAKWA